MKKGLSLIIALTLAFSATVMPVAFAATPAKSTAKTTTPKSQPAPTPAQVQSLVLNYFNAIYNADRKLSDEFIVLSPENIQVQDDSIPIYATLKSENAKYAFLNKVNSVKLVSSYPLINKYFFNISVSTFLAIDKRYILVNQTSKSIVVYDPPTKKYKLLGETEVKIEELYDVRTSPHFKEILKTVEGFGSEYVNWVKEGKQPEINAPDTSNLSYEDTIAHKLNTDQTVIPVQLENVQRVSDTLIVNTKDGQKASITIDLKNHIGKFNCLDIFPELSKNMKSVTLDITANGISSNSHILDQSGISYELLEDNLVKLEFTASEPFIIQYLFLINK